MVDLTGLMGYSFGDMKMVQGRLLHWGTELEEYGSQMDVKVSDNFKRSVLRKGLPEVRNDHLTLNAEQTDTYAKMRKMIVKYLKAKKVGTYSPSKKDAWKKVTEGDSPMYVSGIDKGKGGGNLSGGSDWGRDWSWGAKGKGERGYAKGKGKGKKGKGKGKKCDKGKGKEEGKGKDGK